MIAHRTMRRMLGAGIPRHGVPKTSREHAGVAILHQHPVPETSSRGVAIGLRGSHMVPLLGVGRGFSPQSLYDGAP
jgi:hypothetical protein